MTLPKIDKKNSWQTALINAVTDPEELLKLLQLDNHWLSQAQAAARLFPLKVPHSFVNRMKKGDIHDPLLQQVLPLGIEFAEVAGYSKDPLQEKAANPVPGLLHKYPSRVLLTLTGNCGINCRFCFRRHFPYAENNPGTQGWHQALDYIAKDETILEVILSGGDPLVISDHLLHDFMQKLAAIPHLKRLRIHSRMPIVLPKRITTELVSLFQASRLKIVLVTHCNHPQEIDSQINQAMQALAQAGVILLNQAVLLKDINDDVETLVALSETLFTAGIQPYYLHVLDKVQGAAHFDLDRNVAHELHEKLTHRLSGYLVPRLVIEKPGVSAKLSLENRELYTD